MAAGAGAPQRGRLVSAGAGGEPGRRGRDRGRRGRSGLGEVGPSRSGPPAPSPGCTGPPPALGPGVSPWGVADRAVSPGLPRSRGWVRGWALWSGGDGAWAGPRGRGGAGSTGGSVLTVTVTMTGPGGPVPAFDALAPLRRTGADGTGPATTLTPGKRPRGRCGSEVPGPAGARGGSSSCGAGGPGPGCAMWDMPQRVGVTGCRGHCPLGPPGLSPSPGLGLLGARLWGQGGRPW